MTTRRFLLFTILIAGACARQTTPSGGPQDKTPPVLVRSTPESNQKNFAGKTITLTFDEAIKLKDPKEEIIIAPSAGKDVKYTAKQSRVTIEFENGLKDSTTYSLTFRDGIQDITEGNAADNLRLAFSTGPIIDSLAIIGTVKDAITEKIPEKITVAIFWSDTFNIFKHSPSYLTKADKQGRFTLSNLKPGSYKLYAFDDKNKNLKLETKSEKFGFIPGKIELTKNTDSLRISMIALDSRPLSITNLRNTQKLSIVKLNKNLVHYTIRNNGPPFPTSFGTDQTEVNIFHYNPIADSAAVTFHGLDSLSQAIDTVLYIKSGSGSLPVETFKSTLAEPKLTIEPPSFAARINFTKLLGTISFDTLQLQIDSVRSFPITQKDIRYDTIHRQIIISKPIEKKVLDTLKLPLTLYIGKASFISIDADSSITIKQNVTIPKIDEVATLFLEVQTQHSDFHIELLTTDYKLVKEVVNNPKITFRNIAPGDFKLRAYIDFNKNGKWDPGNILKDIPPEPVYYYRHTDGKYQFSLRAFWEVGPYTFKF